MQRTHSTVLDLLGGSRPCCPPPLQAWTSLPKCSLYWQSGLQGVSACPELFPSLQLPTGFPENRGLLCSGTWPLLTMRQRQRWQQQWAWRLPPLSYHIRHVHPSPVSSSVPASLESSAASKMPKVPPDPAPGYPMTHVPQQRPGLKLAVQGQSHALPLPG